jgi:ADP-heptose:LPS heptosyltransferase
VFRHLQIYDPRERWLVGLADAALTVAAWCARAVPRRRRPPGPQRILLLRLERIGDLLMTLDGLNAVRAFAPGARIDLVVGSWNAPLAGILTGLDHVETLDARWLARSLHAKGLVGLARRAWSWRGHAYDLAINFEGDIRSNLLLALSGARRRVGFDMAGGGPVLTDRVSYDPSEHTGVNALRLVQRAFDEPSEPLTTGASREMGPALPGGTERRVTLRLPAEARAEAARLLEASDPVAGRASARPAVWVGVNPGGGREIKQWDLDRFAAVATRLGHEQGARIVLTGSTEDRAAVDRVRQHIAADIPVLDLAGRLDLVTLAAMLERLALFVTCDSGPMHLAAAVGIPLVAVFGPSDPARWGPLTATARVVRADLACSPCNRIRQPPARCRGHVPDCLAAVQSDTVYRAAIELLQAPGGPRKQDAVAARAGADRA